MAQVRRLGPEVGSCLALFCVHRVNRVNSRNDSDSRWQCQSLTYLLTYLIFFRIFSKVFQFDEF